MMCKIIEEVEANLESANTKELGEAVDMIKDLSEAEYYCSITEAMSESQYGIDYDERGRIKDYGKGRMYFTEMSHYDKAKKHYVEAMDVPTKTRSLTEWVDIIENDLAPTFASMTPEERTIVKQRFVNWANLV